MNAPGLRVIVAEDDENVRAALADLVAAEPDLELVGVVGDADAAVEAAGAARPDVVLLDVSMPGGGGEAAARGIKRRSPGSKVVALTAHDDRSTVLRMVRAGVVGYLVKGAPVDEIVSAVRSAAEGRSSLSIQVTGAVIDELAGELTSKQRTQERRQLSERRIRRVMAEESRLTMAFQPIVSLRERKILGVEALARFAGRPRRAPNAWFAEAHGVGLGERLELQAVRLAVKSLDRLPGNAFLSVNVSPTTLVRSGFRKIVSESDGARLVAEVTEHAQIWDYERLAEAVAKLRALGLRLAVDDTGAGFASLRHILKLDPDLIKLDLSLIRDIHRHRSKQALASGLIGFARASNARIVAEGIERAAEAAKLLELGVDEGQGYYLGRPGPLPIPPVSGRETRSGPR